MNMNIPDEYLPTIFCSYSAVESINNITLCLNICDTGGNICQNNLRHVSYNGAHIFIVCFAMNSIESYKNVYRKWIPEINKYVDDPRIILIGLKKDKKDSIQYRDRIQINGNELAEFINAVNYYECSIFNKKDVSNIMVSIYEKYIYDYVTKKNEF